VHSTNISISSEWVRKISFLYLLLPFLIFCLGFMKAVIAIPITLILIWLVIRNWKNQCLGDQSFSLTRRTLVSTIFVVLLWITLSGIGGFAFQNTDFHTRNAIFRDLINYNWPVKYFTNPTQPTTSYGLTYYIGYWLPAALIGKLGGWQAANIALYFWTVAGILLTLFTLFSSKKSHPVFFVFLLVFFSGMDGMGILLRGLVLQGNYIPPLWPPFMHLEWWTPGLQFSSFTTQLFWVFNQAVPAWLCMALMWTTHNRKAIILIWSLCAFFAPLPALGMFPYVVLKFPHLLFDAENIIEFNIINHQDSAIIRGWKDIYSVLSLENVLGGGIVLIVSFLYFSTNMQSADQSINTVYALQLILYINFVIFEGLLFWIILKKGNITNLNWYLCGILIVIIPLIKVGSAQDFCMRASIPTLFMLMIWSAEMLAAPISPPRIALTILLCIGAITPIYEINRSVYRTANYYLNPPSQSEMLTGEQMKIYDITSFEYDHPYTLSADSFKSLANFNPETITNFLAKTDHSIFYEYLAK
jgi:hypothetical protein